MKEFFLPCFLFSFLQVAPYLIKIDNDSLSGNDQYEGFCKDLLDRLAENLNFKYVLKIPESTVIGELNKETGRYSGLIGELRELVSCNVYERFRKRKINLIY